MRRSKPTISKFKTDEQILPLNGSDWLPVANSPHPRQQTQLQNTNNPPGRIGIRSSSGVITFDHDHWEIGLFPSCKNEECFNLKTKL